MKRVVFVVNRALSPSWHSSPVLDSKKIMDRFGLECRVKDFSKHRINPLVNLVMDDGLSLALKLHRSNGYLASIDLPYDYAVFFKLNHETYLGTGKILVTYEYETDDLPGPNHLKGRLDSLATVMRKIREAQAKGKEPDTYLLKKKKRLQAYFNKYQSVITART